MGALFLLLCGFKSFAVAPGRLTLAWDPSTDASVVGYRLYEGLASESYTNVVDVGSNLQVSVANLVPGATYYFAVTAYDSTGLESAFSGEISYTVPATAPLTGMARLSIAQNESNQAVLSGTGPAGAVYDVYAAMDLDSWLIIGSVTVDTAGLFRFTDQLSQGIAWRFYRLRQHSP